ncbi:MAG TPA: IS1595 family transposase [Candidatus Eremiobacteraceae bacterium]|nr:IS1595 family transposase [Candidatus Eremiobacteraceae bacterium]
MNLNDIAKSYHDEDSARAFLEEQRWPKGEVYCPKCGEIGRAYRLQPKDGAKTHVREGVWKCGGCRKQFTVTVGTIFEDSHIPLHKWLIAIHLLCSSKKGMSAHQLHRMLGVTYKSAWFMAHRIRYAMAELNLPMLKGTVEVDETYIGGKQRGLQGVKSNKAPVVALVERGGKVRSFHHKQEFVTGRTLKQIIHENVDPNAHIMTDDFGGYQGLRNDFRRHSTIRHSWRVYARKEGDVLISTNTIEGYFSILKRGINGVYHHVGKQHLHRYLSEFDFRYNSRFINDGERSLLAIRKVSGRRLTYRDSSRP